MKGFARLLVEVTIEVVEALFEHLAAHVGRRFLFRLLLAVTGDFLSAEFDPCLIAEHDLQGQGLGPVPGSYVDAKTRFEPRPSGVKGLADVGPIATDDAVKMDPIQGGSQIQQFVAGFEENPPANIGDLLVKMPSDRLIDEVAAELSLKHETVK